MGIIAFGDVLDMDVYAVLIGRDEGNNTYFQSMRLQDDKPHRIRGCPDCYAVELFYPEFKVWMYYDSKTIDADKAIALVNITYNNGSLSELLAESE